MHTTWQDIKTMKSTQYLYYVRLHAIVTLFELTAILFVLHVTQNRTVFVAPPFFFKYCTFLRFKPKGQQMQPYP